MFSNKIKIALILAIIFSVSVVSVTQAAPPLQGRSGTSQGHALDLDTEGNNLGAVMKNGKAEDDTGGNGGQNRVAVALANYFGEASYEEIMALHESGVGFGNIARGLFFTSKFDLGIGVADLVAEAGQSGWGKTLRNNGIHPGSIGKGKGQQPEHAGAKISNGQGNGKGKGNKGQSQINSNNGQGNGKAKNKGGSGDGGADVDSDDDDAIDDDTTADIDNDDNGKGKGNKGNSKGKGNGNGNNGQSNDNNN